MGELNLKPWEFWDLTIAEFKSIAEGYMRKQRNELNERIGLAWNIANLVNAAKLPKLEDLLVSDIKETKKQSTQSMINMAKLLTAAFGGEVVEVEGGMN